jgi:hypothetical protein
MSQDNKTHWKRLINPDYIGAYALPPGDDMTVEIVSVGREKVVVSGGKKEDHTVVRLKGQKPLILNSTNSKSIARLYGPYIEDWAGKKITLYASTTKLAGDTVECLRIRPNVAERQKPSIADTRLDAAILSIKKGDYTVQKLKDNFFLTLEQEDKLNAELAPKPEPEPQPQEQGATDA